MQQEMESIWRHNTWDLEPLPSDAKAITCKWIFKLKPGINGEPPTKKARLVARRFEQRPGVDFFDIFAAVIKWATLRTAMALAASKNWNLHHMDVKTAFLHEILKEWVYMRQPPGFHAPGREHLACKLNKSLYGLKQSPRAWYDKIDAALKRVGLHRSKSDGNLYYMHRQGETIILLLYVDDLFITGSSDRLISWLKDFLHNEFDMTDLGKVRRYLGISFEQTTLGILLHQKDYAASILKEFGMQDCRPATTPLPEGQILVADMKSPTIDKTHYYKLVGKLIFLMVTRPDLAYAVSRLSSYMSLPQNTHLEAAKHVLRYIQGTIELGILYNSNATPTISGYADADWGSCTETRRSMGDYIFTMAGGSITWQSKRQPTVSRSSTESE